MKRKMLLISGMLLTLIIVISAIFIIINKDSINNEIVIKEKDKTINNSFLTLMLEQSDGTYEKSISNTWPGEGYIFNKELSKCQNGGKLDYDSKNNKVILYNNKSDGCFIYFDLYTKPIINSINLVETTNNSITISVSTTNGTNEISNYYYIINDNIPISTTNNSYTFSNLESGTTYNIEVYVVDSLGYESNRASLSVETKNSVLLADYIKGLYTSQGSNDIYYHTSSLTNSAGDNSYRYSGANPNNYVCFGSDATPCPSDNLYRIIGVFGNEVKLIKADYTTTSQTGSSGAYYDDYQSSLGTSSNYKGNMSQSQVATYYWNNSTNNNTWSQSNLNTANLNTTYLNSLGSTWRNKIASHTWYVGGHSTFDVTVKEFYNAESSGRTWSGKIGLMYVSDYGYAASNNYWTTNMNSYNSASGSNWMYMGLYEWTISRDSSVSYRAFRVNDSGFVGCYLVSGGNDAVRPSFYLESSTEYVSGSGVQSDPIRIQ